MLESRKMWTVLMLKAIQSLPVDELTSLESEDFADEAASSSIWAAMLTTLMQVRETRGSLSIFLAPRQDAHI